MLADVVGYLRCPHCAAELALEGRVVRCGAGHAFDVARQGYVSLLPGKPRAGSGDSAQMVAAREWFLGAGHFEPLAEALVEAAERRRRWLRARSGRGHRLAARARARLPAARHGVALDVSRPGAAAGGARASAHRGGRLRHLGLAPVRYAAAGLVLNVFAPRNGAEMARVLGPGRALAS